MGSVQQGVDSVAAARSVDEARVRLNVANTNIGLAIDNLANVSNSPEIDNVVPSLVAQNLTRTRDRLALAIEQLPEIGGIEVEGQEELLAFRVDLELLSVQLPVVNVTVINSNIAAGPAADSSSVEVLDVALLAGAVVGLFIGATGAVLIEFADRKLRTLEVLKVVPGLVPIGVVPQDRPKGNPHPPEVTDNSNSVFAEAVHLTATTLQGELGESHTFLISSPGQREGKTMLAINLARALTLRSQRVLLIDANLRKPDASKILGLAEYDGLANALAFEMDPESFVVEVEGLKVLPAGHASVPAVELLSRSGMDSLLQRARAEYDVVILDAPPVGGFSETSTLMRKCRSVVLVLRSGSTEAAELVETVEAVEAVGATVTGAVLNFVAPRELSHLAHDSYVAPPRRGIRKFITSLPLMGTFGSGSDRRKN
jgi:capsular exopolysaccharide synthesis family protein